MMSGAVSQEAVTTLALRAEPMSAQDVLRLALETFRQRAALSSSFGAEDMVLIDQAHEDRPGGAHLHADTGRLPRKPTSHRRDAPEYGAAIEVFLPHLRLTGQGGEHGVNLFYHSVENRKTLLRSSGGRIRGGSAVCRRVEHGPSPEVPVTRRPCTKSVDGNPLVKVEPARRLVARRCVKYIPAQRCVQPLQIAESGIGCAPCTPPPAGEHEHKQAAVVGNPAKRVGCM